VSARFNGDGTRQWTEEEIKYLITQELKPFHDQNLQKFDSLFAELYKLTGSIRTGVWIIGLLIALVGLFLKITR
jgi:hypothetical protein